MQLSDLDKQIVKELQSGLPLVKRPYAALAQRLGISEAELFQRVQELQQAGIMRRIGAALRHHRVGFTANAMIVWQVPEERIEEVGQLVSQLPEVTHCYQREELAHWPFNFYTMVHGRNRAACEQIAVRLSELTGISNYQLLYSVAELKKSSMKYFMD